MAGYTGFGSGSEVRGEEGKERGGRGEKRALVRMTTGRWVEIEGSECKVFEHYPIIIPC